MSRFLIHCLGLSWASLVAQRLKRLPLMQETRVHSLGREDTLEKEMVTHSSTLAWRTPWTEEPGGLQSTGLKESDTTARLHFTFTLRFVIALLPRSKHILISWLQSLSPVVLEPKTMKCQSFHFFPCYLPWGGGTGCHGLSFLHVRLQASFFTFLFYPH